MSGNRWIVGGLVALVAAVAAFFLLQPDGSSAAEGQTEVSLPPGLSRADLEIVIREYILANPEIIPEAMQRLQERQMVDAISAIREELETPFEGAWAGSADADVTVVEFFDYACPYCVTSLPDVERLIAEDDNVRVVFRELPILSEASRDAAQISLAAAQQRRYMDFHRAMFGAGRPSDASIAQARQAAGISASAAEAAASNPAIEAEIRNNRELAVSLGMTGTPAFVVGDQILSGAVGYERLRDAVREARETAGD